METIWDEEDELCDRKELNELVLDGSERACVIFVVKFPP